MSQELTSAEIAAHSAKKDIYMIIHDKVYNVTSFVDEHPGGEEVLLDVGGQDATEAFEDVGHSDEAREILDGLLIGTLKRLPGDPVPKTTTTSSSTVNPAATGLGSVALYVVILVGGVAAFAAYKYLEAKETKA